MALAGAATINTNENGSADVLWTALHNAVACDRVLVGIQTANLRNQDNSLTLGDDFTLTFPLLGVHMSAGYSAYQGYGNPTIKPGDQFEIFGEAKYCSLPEAFSERDGLLRKLQKRLFVCERSRQHARILASDAAVRP